ncbi:MAG TPA: immunoglobulin-like domain-containing protein [Rubricoccaceae bacterium]|jgi:hypothetical protein
MPRFPLRPFVALLLVALAGCNASGVLADVPDASAGPVAPDGLALSADQTAYARGATARLTLRNGSAATATTGVLECAQIETWTGTAWTTSPEGNDRACIMIARVLAPGETMTGTVALDVPPGQYRLVQSVSLEGADAGVAVSTAAFRVGA